MVRVIDYRAVEPRRKVNQRRPVRIPHSPRRLVLATLRVNTSKATMNTKVELHATVGVRGVTGISQLKFRIFRGNTEIFNTQQGIESTGSEQTYTVAFQTVDMNVRTGTHIYRLTVENMTASANATVVGPISFSALAISRSSAISGDKCQCQS